MTPDVAPPGVEPQRGEVASQSPINDVIALILRAGVYISGTILIVGLGLFLVHAPSGNVITNVLRSSSVSPDVPTSIGAVMLGLGSASPTAVIELGVMVLLATPVIRVAASIVLFLVEADWLYSILTAVVLALLLISIFLLGALGVG